MLVGQKKHVLNLINNIDKKKFCVHLHILGEKGTLFSKVKKDIKTYYPKNNH